VFYSVELLAPRPTPKLEEHLLSAVRDCLLNIFAATLHMWGPFSPSAVRGRNVSWKGRAWHGKTHIHLKYIMYSDQIIMVINQAKGKVKLKLFLCFFFNSAPLHEGVLGSRGRSPRILDLGTRWRWVVGFTARPLYPQGKKPWCPLNRSLGGSQSRSGRGGEEKNSQPLLEIEPPIIQTNILSAVLSKSS
jgi:hypothetical protein